MNPFANTLRSLRRAQRLSQLELAGIANVSARHISFLEKGRSQPSREMVTRLAEALQQPLTVHNRMLVDAGFAARYEERSWEAQEMAPICAALDHTLQGHAPYPAIALDRLWSIVKMNSPAEHLFAPLGVGIGTSLLALMLSEVLPGVIENWTQVAHHAAQRLRTESSAQGGVPELERAADALDRVPDTHAGELGPVVPTIYVFGSMRLSMFSTIAQFGTPLDLTLDDLKIELFFPADAETDAALRSMADLRICNGAG